MRPQRAKTNVKIFYRTHRKDVWEGELMFSVCSPPRGGGGGGRYPSQLPSPFPRLWSGYTAGGTPRAVSNRRTFLYLIVTKPAMGPNVVLVRHFFLLSTCHHFSTTLQKKLPVFLTHKKTYFFLCSFCLLNIRI